MMSVWIYIYIYTPLYSHINYIERTLKPKPNDSAWDIRHMVSIIAEHRESPRNSWHNMLDTQNKRLDMIQNERSSLSCASRDLKSFKHIVVVPHIWYVCFHNMGATWPCSQGIAIGSHPWPLSIAQKHPHSLPGKRGTLVLTGGAILTGGLPVNVSAQIAGSSMGWIIYIYIYILYYTHIGKISDHSIDIGSLTSYILRQRFHRDS